MKQLIINADDYGRTPDISRGIRFVHLRGVVTSTTCMMNIPTAAHDVSIAIQETSHLGLGVHLVLTMGKPILPPQAVPSIVDKDGNHFQYDAFLANIPNLNMDEVKAEWRAQIERFIKAAGRKPDHLDSHHHSSYLTPELFRAMLEIANEYGCPVRNPISHGNNPTESMPSVVEPMREYAPHLMKELRVRSTNFIFVNFYDEGATAEVLIDNLGKMKDGQTYELMCHPGHIDEAFANESSYNSQRERELQILTDPTIKHIIESHGIRLINFANL